MNNKSYFLNMALTVVLGIAILVCILLRTFMPMVILPELSIPNMVLVSAVALVIDHYAVKEAGRCYIGSLLIAILTFGLLPWVSGFALPREALKLGITGGITFVVTALLYKWVQQRLASGPAAKVAPVFSALCLYLAAQCLM